MTYSENMDLRAFLGQNALTSGCQLYLPKFSGGVALRGDKSSVPPLSYAGDTLSERDAKAALYVTSVLGHAIDSDKIRLEDAAMFPEKKRKKQTAFLFGSRSNPATMWAVQNAQSDGFFNFDFGAQWEIKCKNGRSFSLPDPSRLGRGAYASKTDYGVIARISGGDRGYDFFLIAGLGGRATEGCGYYFSRHWREIFHKFGERDFAVILKFPPPLNPKRSTPVALFGEEERPGTLPAVDETL